MAFRALFVAFIIGSATAAKVTPIQKVLELMEEMKAKGIASMKEEEVKFSAFSQWCTDTKRIKTDEIKADEAKMEELSAEIEKAAVLIKKLTERILELEEDVARWVKDKKSATTVREAEKVDYAATFTDYTESIRALEQALSVLKKREADVAQADVKESLIQVRSLKLVDDHAKGVLTSFLQQDPELTGWSAPEAAGYEFQSGGVVDMLQKLLDQFTEEKRKLEMDELNAQNAFEQIMQQLSDDIENADFEINKKTKLRAETQEKKAELEGELAATTKERDEDTKYFEDTVALCDQKTTDFNSRQKLRGEELDAISKAIEIISSEAVAGSGEKHLPALVQIASKRAAGFAQLRSGQTSPIQQKLAVFLNQQAQKSGSRLLAEMAMQVEANPFGKVKKMIKDLIVKLMEEATEEAEHKGWCDTELTTNKQTRDRKSEEVAEYTDLIEELTAAINDLTQDIADLTKAVKELDANMAKATKIRDEAKATNMQSIKDAKAAQVAVDAAMAVLKDFYAKSAEATAFNQGPAEDAPVTFEKPYKGLLAEGGSVVDFLEVILSDFVRLEEETTGAEAAEAETYSTFMFESKKDKALKEGEIKLKSETKTDKESALQQAQADLKTSQEQLDKALAYYEKLKPTCVDSGITYEERVKKREEEIVSLQEALKILSGTDLPTLG
jgi:tetratricopeptide (TPR) repeat protein|mmetsp:Transcript_29661/g.47770  ORF Transcript_29661/g.47770 Transcript_29661/m.47770 type:complete len:673 (-) Transcript_29661:38-2056(-)|eukprot:CAMPEP_0169113890 /NCGR_PEP_ID=MMETSP1015-20121227/28452_1 /TAXON_ID=342587 /ORGANISM="Karlodinium micrum, Strain CCMP2283" /LENGTH=672 /DNA_ID=CAMNT_0009176109 /DNA_START=65 /DNA_END=2083 /DNA_ORIENTATION=-